MKRNGRVGQLGGLLGFPKPLLALFFILGFAGTSLLAQEPPATLEPPQETAPAQEHPATSEPQQEAAPAPPQRLKVGLALSGGGARGATHVGILRALEELHVPVDYIAGTSMGSIVGGLYASGMTPDEIEETLATADWETLFTDQPPRKDLPFRRKQDDRRYLDLEAGFDRKGIHTGLGLIAGQHLNAFLETLTLKAGKVEDFDRLPIPFRCVATDIVTGERVVFSKGHLATAIRASMSIPTVFTPVEVGDHLLVDGGLTDNLPVDVVKAMGADVVIAVDISTPPKGRDQLRNFLSISSQMISILMQKNVADSSKAADILIRPDLKGFKNMNFVDAGSLIPVGYEAAMSRREELGRYSIDEAEHAAAIARIRSALPPLPAKLDFVKFEGTDAKSQALVRGKMSTKPGQPFDAAKVGKDLDRVFAAGEFQSVSYRLAEEGGQQGLVISAKPNTLGPNRVRFGLQLSTDFKNESNWAVLAGFRMTRFNALGGEWKTDLEVGLNRRLYSEFYQPLNMKGRWFVAPYVDYFNIREDFYPQVNDRGATFRVIQGGIGVDLGLSFGQYGELRVGPEWGFAKYNNILGPDFFEEYGFQSRARISGIRARLTLDHLNSADFPTQGYLLEADNYNSIKDLGGEDDFRRAKLRFRAYGTRGKNTYLAGLVGGTAFGSDMPPYAFFQAGGFDSFAGYQTGQLVGRYYAVARLGYSRQIGQLPPMLGKGFYVYFWGDVGNVWVNTKDIDWGDLRYSGTLAAGTETRVGPLYVGLSRTSDGDTTVTFYLGKRF